MATVFVSHSSVDKNTLIQPLVDTLRARNHDVWYDTEAIQIGDSVTLAISDGLTRSRHYIIAISSSFLASSWCMRELGAIVSESISRDKRLIVLRVNNAHVPAILSDIHRIEIQTAAVEECRNATDRILRYLEGEQWCAPSARSYTPHDYATLLFQADRDQRFGNHLLTPDRDENLSAPQNEGVILIKPGGTFHEPCLREIFRRISTKCRIRQVRLYDGDLIQHRHLFDEQYVTSTKIAKGEIRLTRTDLEKIRQIYGRTAFKNRFGVEYNDNLIVPALHLCAGPYNLLPEELARLWEQGRESELFHNQSWNGLNKIGYQKSVFPIEIPSLSPPRVRLVLNGFIPGYKHLFTTPTSRVIAIHVSSEEPWRVVREELVGGNSDPLACQRGSIRRDAAERQIPLASPNDVVNGQRNVCHCSATLFDGMRELITWFEYRPSHTLLGRLFELQGFPVPEQAQAGLLPTISWWSRDYSIGRVLFEVCLSFSKEELRLQTDAFQDRVSRYALLAGTRPESIRQAPAFAAFINNGMRLSSAKDDLYLRCISELFNNREKSILFYEVAKEIRSLAAGRPDISAEVLAEAYRIAAGDLRFLDCPAYVSDCESFDLFKSLVVAELPEEALECAIRAEKNLVKDFRALNLGPDTEEVLTIQDNPAWKEFESMSERLDVPNAMVALVLCGGRSTRMASTIPKPVLPFRRKLLFTQVRDTITAATGGGAEIVAAVGFRSRLVKRALGTHVRCLTYEKTLGLAFRVATALESMADFDGVVLLSYTDMPLVSPEAITELLKAVDARRRFGLLTSVAPHLSGHIVESDRKVIGIVQQRLDPDKAHFWMRRDVGVYAFYNTEEFRSILRAIRNDNARREYIFADVVAALSDRGWDIVSVNEEPSNAYGINTAGELLATACGVYRANLGAVELGEILKTMATDYRMPELRVSDIHSLPDMLRMHSGPLHFFHWWNAQWQ